ncbi:uncharacterized protein LOC110974836 [Acanthaster planci]|uniref:Uncharacterized protein LOC110974836 n=1 Tax=Acanthaster planci TaxID=133434 RepID=A0A8B7XR06_ACAPL|nr:uncharacterized protein LOC110974836 [Acanthaster planci]
MTARTSSALLAARMAWPTISSAVGALLFVYALLVGFAAWAGAALTPWCSVVDTALVGWNVSSIHTRTHKLCHVACLESANCSSANYWWQSKVCELNTLSHLSVSESHLVKASGSIYTFTEQMTGCTFTSSLSSHDNGHKPSYLDGTRDPDWQLVFKGVAGTGAKLYDMWTSESWDPSVEISGSCRDNDLHRVWRNKQLHVRRVKLSLHNSTGKTAELVFNGIGSDIRNWFRQDRLISSPWEDLSSASASRATRSGRYFSMEGHVEEDRRFYINANYQGCSDDVGWLVVTESQIKAFCSWEDPTTQYPYPIILYSRGNNAVTWNNVLSNDRTVGRADSMTIHINIDD